MNALEIFFRQRSPAPLLHRTQSHNTLPIRGTITHIDGYPRKLVLYQMEASPYWQVRYFEDGRIIRRSTRISNKQDAIKRAKEIFADITINRVQGQVVTRLRERFATVAFEQMEQQKVRVLRGEITAATQENDHNRLRRDILPYFGHLAFDLVLQRAGLKISGRGELRTLYCLRHTAIMERLRIPRLPCLNWD